ncbi:MAG: glycosyltransferase [Rhodobacteraceae bacterium]|nr:glycosyltransferase [Paracoccaceae bacterium]
MTGTSPIGAVVIGRNEGARLIACLTSLTDQVEQIVYVDSGSTDGSVHAARDLGAKVVELDMSRPFTAARARNAGLAQLNNCELVQFVDGDCIVEPGWIVAASVFLHDNPKVAVVCGRRREDHPQTSIYNRLCDHEWNTPVGEAKACGGDAMMRRNAVEAVAGYREDLIAGEEPELCLRLRREGWTIWRIDQPMTRHDARMTRFSQWWQRCRRAGHAFAEGADLHGRAPEHHWVAETRRAITWGLFIPALILFLSFTTPNAWLFLTLYPLQVIRLHRHHGWLPALFLTLSKFPETQGILEYHLRKRFGTKRDLIEYK